MWKNYRLRGQQIFTKIIKRGRRIFNREFIIFYSSNQLSQCRFGTSVPKKLVNNKPLKNYYKRQIREIIIDCLKGNHKCPIIKNNHCDFVIIVNANFLANDFDFTNKKKSLQELMTYLPKKDQNISPLSKELIYG